MRTYVHTNILYIMVQCNVREEKYNNDVIYNNIYVYIIICIIYIISYYIIIL